METKLLIHKLGISSKYAGFDMLIYAVNLTCENEDMLKSITKKLYPQIAKHFNTSSLCVERNIRTVINVCWEKGNRELLNEIAGYPLKEKPSVSEFIDIIATHLYTI